MPLFLHRILLRSHHHLDSLEVHWKLVVAIGSRFQCDSHGTKHSSPERRICSPSYIAASLNNSLAMPCVFLTDSFQVLECSLETLVGYWDYWATSGRFVTCFWTYLILLASQCLALSVHCGDAKASLFLCESVRPSEFKNLTRWRATCVFMIYRAKGLKMYQHNNDSSNIHIIMWNGWACLMWQRFLWNLGELGVHHVFIFCCSLDQPLSLSVSRLHSSGTGPPSPLGTSGQDRWWQVLES